MRAFYRIRRADWPLTVDGEESRANCIALGGTAALLIVHSSIYPNPDIEALPAATFLGNTFADLLQSNTATATQKAKVFETAYLGSTGGVARSKNANVPSTAPVVKANLIPHSWGGRESKTEQADVDGVG